MAKFQGIFCHPFLPSVLIIEGLGGMDGGVGWDGMGRGGMGWGGVGGVGGGKNHPWGHPMSSHDAHTVANNTLVGHTASGSKYRYPLSNWRPPMGPIVPAVTLEGRQNALEKSRPVNI